MDEHLTNNEQEDGCVELWKCHRPNIQNEPWKETLEATITDNDKGSMIISRTMGLRLRRKYTPPQFSLVPTFHSRSHGCHSMMNHSRMNLSLRDESMQDYPCKTLLYFFQSVYRLFLLFMLFDWLNCALPTTGTQFCQPYPICFSIALRSSVYTQEVVLIFYHLLVYSLFIHYTSLYHICIFIYACYLQNICLSLAAESVECNTVLGVDHLRTHQNHSVRICLFTICFYFLLLSVGYSQL